LTLAKTGTYTDLMKTPRAATSILLLCALTAGAGTRLGAQAQERTLYVTALDRTGAPVSDLAISDLVVREDDVTREILRIAPAVEPMQVAILVDNSAAAEPIISDYRDALPALIRALTEEAPAEARHEVAVIAVGERPTVLADYTSDAAEALKGVQRIFALSQSGSYLLNGFLEVSQGLVKRGATRPVIVAITTEGPELSDRYYQHVLDELKKSGAAVHVVIVGRPANPDQDRYIVLDRGTRDSGGSYNTLLTGTALAGKLQQLGAELTHQYRVTYARPARLIPPERVTVSAARDGLTVRGTPVGELRTEMRR
jgi:hypothetical protein